MIKFRVREIAEKQGLNIQRLASKSGIAYSTILDLWHDRVRRIDKATLNRLCEALNVTPGDLIIRDPDDIELPELIGEPAFA
jgi:putative transcriptional regulator